VDAEGLALPDEVPAAGPGVGLTGALARADGLAGATVGDGAALVAVATAGATGAEVAAEAGVAAAEEAAGADEATGAGELSAGAAEWLFAVQAAVTRIGAARKTVIARSRCGRGVSGTGVILADRLPV
jgi:hypothetical protein